MAEASFIPPSAETLPVASSAVVPAANAAAEGIFAGMLAQRLQSQTAAGTETGGATPVASTTVVTANQAPAEVADSGQRSPQTGKALPAVAEVAGNDRDGTGADLANPTLQALLGADNLSPLLAGSGQAASVASQPQALEQNSTQLPAVEDPLATLSDDFVDVVNQTTLAASEAPTVNPNLPPAALGEGSKAKIDELRRTPVRPQTNAALQWAKALEGPATAVQEAVRQPAASLGLNAAATGEQLRNTNAALAAEQVIRSRVTETPVNQALSGDALSRQFQQQVDRLLVNARTSKADTSLLTSLSSAPAVDSLAGASVDSSLSTILPGFATDLRGASPAGLLTGVSVPVATPVGQPAWSSDLGQRMVWLANQEIREAQIQLNPRNLGPIDVRIAYSDTQQLSVSFNAQNPAAREALDAALPRLREMFEQQGLSLGDASVSQESFTHQQRDSDRNDRFPSSGHDRNTGRHAESFEGDAPLRPPPVILGSGILDTFA